MMPFKPSFHRRALLLATVAVTAMSAGSAWAQPTAEDVRAAITSLAQRSGLSVAIGGAQMDGTTVTLTDLSFEGDGNSQVIEQAVLTGVADAGNGSISADTMIISAFIVNADGTLVDVGPTAFETVHIGSAEEDDAARSFFHAERYTLGPVEVRVDGLETFGFDGASIANTPLATVPMDSDFAINGMRLNTQALDDPRAQATMSALGYETVTANVTGETSWNGETGMLAINDMTLSADDAADLAVNLEIGGYTAELVQSMSEISTQMSGSGNDAAMGMAMLGLMQQLEFTSMSIGLKDQSLTGRILDFVAEQQGTSREGITAMAKAMAPSA